MLFSSAVFLFAFLPLVLVLYYGPLRRRGARNVLLTIASLFFYAWGEPRFVLVMLLSILANYGFGLWVHHSQGRKGARRAAIVATVVFNLAVLFVFKYLNFTLQTLGGLFPGLPQTGIALPIGISFFTFQAMSYVFDVARGQGEAQKNPLYVALYISFFPQLIAGPIVRYETVAVQIKHRNENFDDFALGVRRFLVGFCKKVLLANNLAIVADAAFNQRDFGQLSAGLAVLGVLAYALQIFYDFSGYSDMAIGLGKMFGFHFLENFNFPYISASVSEFWRRWHISLGTWFRDYVYFPLGGSRVQSRGRLVFNLFVVWALTGIWHGANWTFVLWGLGYFVLITFEKLSGWPARFKHGWQRLLWRLFTLVCVLGGWVLFRAESLGLALRYGLGVLGLNGNPLWDATALLYLKEFAFFFGAGLLLCAPIGAFVQKQVQKLGKKAAALANGVGTVALFVLFVLAVAYLAKGSYNPFIYFNF